MCGIVGYIGVNQAAPIILDGLEDPHNLGAVMRTAECAGAHGIIIPKRRSVSVNETVLKTSAGAAEHMLCAKVTNIGRTIDELKNQGVWVYACDMGDELIYDQDMTGPLAIVIGSFISCQSGVNSTTDIEGMVRK